MAVIKKSLISTGQASKPASFNSNISASVASAKLATAKLQSAKLQSAKLQSAKLQSAKLQSAKLQVCQAAIREAPIRETAVREASIREASIRQAEHSNAGFLTKSEMGLHRPESGFLSMVMRARKRPLLTIRPKLIRPAQLPVAPQRQRRSKQEAAVQPVSQLFSPPSHITTHVRARDRRRLESRARLCYGVAQRSSPRPQLPEAARRRREAAASGRNRKAGSGSPCTFPR
jgi:hypothetical protein